MAPAACVRTLADGGRILVRPLEATDRDELALRYEELSAESRRRRFVSAPEHLSPALLDHLLDVDGADRVALVAVDADDPAGPGIGIARYLRNGERPAEAEIAVTVLDAHQRRGIGTALAHELATVARAHGITAFTASVMWDNVDVLEALRLAGATVTPDEPGLAAVRIELPEVDGDTPPDSSQAEALWRRVLRVLAGQASK
jgi:GNAT superfamily N-acetyltransferase